MCAVFFPRLFWLSIFFVPCGTDNSVFELRENAQWRPAANTSDTSFGSLRSGFVSCGGASNNDFEAGSHLAAARLQQCDQDNGNNFIVCLLESCGPFFGAMAA